MDNRSAREAVTRAIKAAGLSQAELARRAGLHRPNVCDWLSGKGDIRVETLESLMAVLGLTIVPRDTAPTPPASSPPAAAPGSPRAPSE